MVKSLKDALMGAGLKSSRTENERPKMRKKDKNKTQLHQEERNFCELCERIFPDVEHYKHRNPTIDVRWLCLGCADKNEIMDRFRTTAQSEYSKKGIFRREYGETAKFDKDGNPAENFDRRSKPQRNSRSNRHDQKRNGNF